MRHDRRGSGILGLLLALALVMGAALLAAELAVRLVRLVAAGLAAMGFMAV